MKKTIYLILITSLFSIVTNTAQINLSVYAEVSIVTAGPGNELYEKFGHSAIRIKDPVLNLDLIYNYGIFDFDAPNFYTNFAQGKMYYLLARYDFKYFMASYKKDKRWLKQQVLNITVNEKQQFFNYLEKNALKENATYMYDPFFNNCASKLSDIIKIVLKSKVNLQSDKIANNKSLRTLMDQEINWNTWGSFGINLIAGTILDIPRNQLAYNYLPDYLYKTIKYGTLIRANAVSNLVLREDSLLHFKEPSNSTNIWSPFTIFSILFLFVTYFTYSDYKKNKRTKFIDFSLFLSTGLIGILLIFLWLFSSHKTAPSNFNVLWAFIPNVFVAFVLLKNKIKDWLQYYVLLLLVYLGAIVLCWLFNIQSFPIALIPILLMLLIRYLFLYKFLLTSKK